LLIIAVAAALISEPMLGWFVVAALSLGMMPSFSALGTSGTLTLESLGIPPSLV
jgi:hypothetical protein